VVSIAGIRGTHKKLQLPTLQEGFDDLFEVCIQDRAFQVRIMETGS
jgi:hypothetical protein